MNRDTTDRLFLKKFAWLSVAAAIFTIAFKTYAYALTNSVGMLSDAMESIVNLIGALMALSMLHIAAKPADDDHAYGHSKAEYFSSGVEGTLILIAALGIGAYAIKRLITPQPIEQIGLGIAVSIIASLVNLITALILRRAGKKYNSITLESNSSHLMTDVWTSAGVLIALGAVAITGWQILDPIIALAVAANIIWIGIQIMHKSVLGLMDTSLPAEDLNILKNVLEQYTQNGIQFHAMRTREAGARKFISFHVIVPGDWTVDHGHHLLEQIEKNIRIALPNANVFTHLESLSDPASWDDVELDRN
jgi:cation diffusion facilitator family transporter